jgi:hypothetical protein
LNDTIPKHRKIRIQQVSLLITQSTNLSWQWAQHLSLSILLCAIVVGMWYYVNVLNETYEKNRRILMNR